MFVKIILLFLFRETRARCMGLTVNQWLDEFDSHTRSQFYLGTVVGYGSPLQGGCLEGFDFLGLHQIYTAFDFRWGHQPFKLTRRDRYPYAVPVYLCKALSGCVHRLGRCGEGSNPSTETNNFYASVVQRIRIRCYERWDGSSILSRGTKLCVVSLMVKSDVANV